MSYRRFETDNAEYLLQLMMHGFKENLESVAQNGRSQVNGIDISLFNDVDGIVIEEFSGRLKKTARHWKKARKDPLLLQTHIPYLAIEKAAEQQIPFYCTDVPLERRRPHPSLNALNLAQTIVWTLNGVQQQEKLMNIFAELMSELSYLEMGPVVEGRNAVNAEKLERWVAPRMQQLTGKKKPLIGLLYGFFHTSLEPNLQDPERRQKVIKRMRRYAAWDTSRFNKADEGIYIPSKKIARVERFNTRCFG